MNKIEERANRFIGSPFWGYIIFQLGVSNEEFITTQTTKKLCLFVKIELILDNCLSFVLNQLSFINNQIITH